MRAAVGQSPGADGGAPAGDGELRRRLRGYSARRVDALLDRCAATLGPGADSVAVLAGRPTSGAPGVTAGEVRAARFPVVLGGYDLAEVDAALRQLARLLPDPDAEGRAWTAGPVPPTAGEGPALRTVWRGYDRDEVDAFLVRCAHSLRGRVGEVPELAPLTGRPRTGEALLARDVDRVQFRLVRRGYPPQDVDALLDRVRAVLARP